MCMCVGLGVYMCTTCIQVPMEAREGTGFSGTGVTDKCELPVLGGGKQVQVLWKNSKCYEPQKYLSNPIVCFALVWF